MDRRRSGRVGVSTDAHFPCLGHANAGRSQCRSANTMISSPLIPVTERQAVLCVVQRHVCRHADLPSEDVRRFMRRKPWPVKAEPLHREGRKSKGRHSSFGSTAPPKNYWKMMFMPGFYYNNCCWFTSIPMTCAKNRPSAGSQLVKAHFRWNQPKSSSAAGKRHLQSPLHLLHSRTFPHY